ncbi:hypothetical protein ACN26Y_02980 [Micromonospora sp. WMMD558]|uniref:hypothetical protein n=1 Tax=Micromonospora sp. WMMD558 TaxID=3403462 RepID=UPI003BF50449
MINSWAVRLGEKLDQSSLDELRSKLGMRASGRLTDDWDELFGEGTRAIGDKSVQVELWRDVDTSEWRLDIEMPSELSEAQAARVLAEVQEAAASMGLTIVSSLRRPSRR